MRHTGAYNDGFWWGIMADMGNRIRKAFTFASGVDTITGWITPFLPKGLIIGMVWLAGIAVGFLQGMTPAGALLLSLLCGGAATFTVNQAYRVAEHVQANRFSPRHKEKMLELADALAELKSLVLHPGNWSRMDPAPHQTEHAARYQAARTRVDKIAQEIRYDSETYATAVDFSHLCSMVVSDLLARRDYREQWADLDRISAPIFQRLHRGKGIRRSEIPWPQWILDNDAEAAAKRAKEGK